MALNIDRWMAQGQSRALSAEMQANLGGTVYFDLTAASHNVTVPDECQNVHHVLQGSPTGNRAYTFPSLSGFYFVDVQAVSAFTINLAVANGQTLTVTNGQKLIVWVDGLLGTIESVGGSGTPGSGAQVSITHANSPYIVPGAYDTIYVDTVTTNPSSLAVSVVLPDAAGNGMREICIIGTTAANAISITSAGGTMNGVALWTLNMILGLGQSITFKSDGTNWWSK